MTEGSSKLPTQTSSQAEESVSKESQEIQQSKDRPVIVLSDGEREALNTQIKSQEVKEECTSQSAEKLSTPNLQPVQPSKPDGANKVLDDNASVASTVQDILASHDRIGKKLAQQCDSETTSCTSSTLAQKPITLHTSEKASVTHTTTEKPSVPDTPANKPNGPHIPTEKPGVPHIPTGKQSVPHTPTEKPDAPHTSTEKPSVPHTPTDKPGAPHTSTEKPSVPHTPTEKLGASHTPTEKSSVPHAPADKPSAPHSSTEKPNVPPAPAVQHTPTEKPSVLHTPIEKPIVSHIPKENTSIPHSLIGKPSSSSSQVPSFTVTHPKTTMQAAHVSDVGENKLELPYPEKITEVPSHSEHSKNVEVKSTRVKPVLSQMSSKAPEDGTKHDTHNKQQRKRVEESQKGETSSQEPDSTTQSAGKVPKEASVLADKNASKMPEIGKNASRMLASKHEKVMYCLLFLQFVV
jgi:hypothetical protein